MSRSLGREPDLPHGFKTLASVMSVMLLLLSGCSKPLPEAFVAAGWDDAKITDRDQVAGQLTDWLSRAEQAEGSYVILDGSDTAEDAGELTIEHADGWRAVTITGIHSDWDGHTIGSEDNPVTVWTRDMAAGELFPDTVVCDRSGCVDVTAWYLLAEFSDMLPFPNDVAGLLPQDAAALGRVGLLDPWPVRYKLETIDDEVNITTYENGKSTEYHLEDRVYVIGHRRGGTGREDCVGWFDRAGEMTMGEDRFVYFCFATSAGVFSGSLKKDTLLTAAPLRGERARPFRPEVTIDLYAELSIEQREFFRSGGFVTDEWASRHGG